MENFGKTAVFPGGYGRIGEIPHGRIWPDWGLKGYITNKQFFTEKDICIPHSVQLSILSDTLTLQYDTNVAARRTMGATDFTCKIHRRVITF